MYSEISKRKHLKNDEDDSDTAAPQKNKKQKTHDSDDETPVQPQINPFAALLNNDNRVYRIDNHIYFTSEVTMDNINKMAKYIHQINKEFEIIKTSIRFAEIQAKPIYLHITSNGGNLFGGFRAVDIIDNSKIPIHTVAEGFAISAASLMYVAGKKRYMTKNAYVLIHQLKSCCGDGTFEELKDSFENNKALMDRIVNIYHEKSNKKMKKLEIRNALKKDILWDFDKCRKSGIADEIYCDSV